MLSVVTVEGVAVPPLTSTDDAPNSIPAIWEVVNNEFNAVNWLFASAVPDAAEGAAPPSQITEPYFTPNIVIAFGSEPPIASAKDNIKL